VKIMVDVFIFPNIVQIERERERQREREGRRERERKRERICYFLFSQSFLF